LVLIFEDLHWIDSESHSVLDGLVESLPSARILLLLSYRPEYRHGWEDKPFYTRIVVDGLPPKSVEELLNAHLGTDAALNPLRRALMDRADGNPFFLEEMVRSLLETKVLAGPSGGYHLTNPVDALRVPPTVQAVLAARIDRLSTDAKWLLQCAAVIGTRIPLMILQAIAELPFDQLRRCLSNLQDAEVLYENAMFPDVEYNFKHSLTHEVAYSTLRLDRRKTLHRKIASAIEEGYQDRLPEQVERLAHHCFQGEDWEKALDYLRQAGAKALARSAYREATRSFDNALVTLDYLPRSSDRDTLSIDIRLGLRNALTPVGDFEGILRHLDQARILAELSNDKSRGGWVSAYTATCFWTIGKYHEALENAGLARRLALELDERELRIYANLVLCWTHHSLGGYEQGIQAGREALTFLPPHRVHEHFGIPSLPAAVAHTWLALSLAECGRFAEAMDHGDEAVRIAEAVGEPWSSVSAYLALAGVYLGRGSYSSASAILERGLNVYDRFKIDVWFPPIAASLGHAYAHSGRLTEGITLMSRAADQSKLTRLTFYHSAALIWLSEAYVLAGKLDEARGRAAEALTLSEGLSEAGNQAYALRALGEIEATSETPHLDEAERCYRKSLDLASALQMRPLIARCYAGLANTKTGSKSQDSMDNFSRAGALFQRDGDDGLPRKRLSVRSRPRALYCGV
jgi:tetratricopeptide (TPR) repeat protein